MPAEAWTRTLRWTSGRERAASWAADSRLTEVLVHLIGDARAARAAEGAQTPLPAWLLGRSDGAELGARLPRLPFRY
jgi:hypothetical protein